MDIKAAKEIIENWDMKDILEFDEAIGVCIEYNEDRRKKKKKRYHYWDYSHIHPTYRDKVKEIQECGYKYFTYGMWAVDEIGNFFNLLPEYLTSYDERYHLTGTIDKLHSDIMEIKELQK